MAGSVNDDWAIVALFEPDRLVDAAFAQLWVMPLTYDPYVQDLFWCRLYSPDAEARAELAHHQIPFGEPGQVPLALGPADDVHLHGAHGHNDCLRPIRACSQSCAWTDAAPANSIAACPACRQNLILGQT